MRQVTLIKGEQRYTIRFDDAADAADAVADLMATGAIDSFDAYCLMRQISLA